MKFHLPYLQELVRFGVDVLVFFLDNCVSETLEYRYIYIK